MMVDTTKIADEIDGLADKEVKVGGMKLSLHQLWQFLLSLALL